MKTNALLLIQLNRDVSLDILTTRAFFCIGSVISDIKQRALASSSTIAAAAAANVGWVWRDKGNGTFCLYACDSAGAEYVE